MKRRRLRRWIISLAVASGLASAVLLPLAGPAAGQFGQPQCIAGAGYTNFPNGVILPCNSPFVTGSPIFSSFAYGPGAFSTFGFPGFGGLFFPTGPQQVGTVTNIYPVGGNVPTIVTQPVYAQPTYSTGYSAPYPGSRGVYGDPYGYVNQAPYVQSSGPQQQQQEQQQAVQSPGVVVTQSQQQQQQSSGTGYGFWGGGSDQQEQQQQQSVS